jgi:hypothetical protein
MKSCRGRAQTIENSAFALGKIAWLHLLLPHKITYHNTVSRSGDSFRWAAEMS